MNQTEKVDRAQIRAARALLNWTQPDLAEAAEIALATLKRYEIGHQTPIRVVKAAIVRALEDEGIEFLDDGKKVGVFISHKKLEK
jgi:transcriptional regulator with XRE-family HTH domain